MTRHFAHFRTAFSITCATIAVLLVALWVRSYRWCDIAYFPVTTNRMVTLRSEAGRIECLLYLPAAYFDRDPMRSGIALAGWGTWSYRISTSRDKPQALFDASSDVFEVRVMFPHFLPVFLLGALSILQWMRLFAWRFSLVTCLVCTTMIAFVLWLLSQAMR